MFRSKHIIVSLALVTLLAGLPGGSASAAGAGVRLVIRLDAPAAVLRCTECAIGEHRTVVGEAVRSLGSDSPASGKGEVTRFIRKGATFGGENFSGTAVDVRRIDSDTGSKSPHFVAL